MWKQRGRPGPFVRVNGVSVYLGGQRREEGSLIRRTHFTHVFWITISTFFALWTFVTQALRQEMASSSFFQWVTFPPSVYLNKLWPYKEDIFYYRSCKNLYQVLWVVCTSKPAMKLKVHMIKIIITIVPRYTGTKHITRLLPLALLLRVRTYSNTDSNRLIFSRLGSMMILVICIALILHIWPWRSFLVSFEKTYLEAFFQLLILCHTKVRWQ